MDFTQLELAVLWTAAVVGKHVRSRIGDERGEITEKVIIVSLFAVASITIAAIIIAKLTTTANNVRTPDTVGS